jgi:hypothetical protein
MSPIIWWGRSVVGGVVVWEEDGAGADKCAAPKYYNKKC